MVGLARVARGEMSREAYLEQWGHRGALETEAQRPGPSEDPDWLDQQLAAFAQSPVDVESLLAAQRAEFDAAWERFQSRYPRQVKAVRRRMEKAAEARPDARSGPLREHADHLGGSHLGSPRWRTDGIGDGVFYLTIDELLDLLAGRDAPTATIPARRQTYERYKALPPYPLLIRGRFDPFQWAADPERRSDSLIPMDAPYAAAEGPA